MIQNIVKHTSDEARELRGLFEKQLKESLWTESKLAGMLSDIIENVFSGDLKELVKKQSRETAGHILRIEKIFTLIGIPADTLPYQAIQCYIDEAFIVSENTRQGVVRDAALIAMLQKVKHYEIACYGTMRAYAIALKEEDVITLLEQILNEEKEADLALSYIAESHINIEAADKEI